LSLAVNELAMDLRSSRVDDGNLKALIVAQTVVAEMLRKLFAVRDSLKIAVEVDPDPISNGTLTFISKKNFCIAAPQIDSAMEDHERDTTLGNGLPRFRALARMIATDRFNETAMLAGDVPSSISAIRSGPLSIFCCQCAPW
jgi:acyl-CoA hydrolase